MRASTSSACRPAASFAEEAKERTPASFVPKVERFLAARSRRMFALSIVGPSLSAVAVPADAPTSAPAVTRDLILKRIRQLRTAGAELKALAARLTPAGLPTNHKKNYEEQTALLTTSFGQCLGLAGNFGNSLNGLSGEDMVRRMAVYVDAPRASRTSWPRQEF